MDLLPLIKSPIIAELEAFNQLFDASLSSSNPLLRSVITHIRQQSGKMMRPILVLLTARLYGQISSESYHAAVSLELLHTASLVHDDVVDESPERRGQLSVNAIYNNKIAVLTGDFLLATSLVHAGKAMNHEIISVVSCLGQDLAEGEILQLSNVVNPEFSEGVYFEIILKKTATLFAACTRAGALSVHATAEQVECARLLGECIGICFQIKDDIFDYFDSREIGKPTGNDMVEGKLTLPVLHVLNTKGDEWAREVALKVKQRAATSDEIARLIDYTKANGGIEYATGVMHEYKCKALNMLREASETEVAASLSAYLDYVIERTR